MKDLKKIQEFFSKPINEVGEGTAGSYKYNKSTDSEYKTEYTFTTDSGLNYIVEFAFEEDEAAFVDFYVKSDVKGNEFTQVFNKGELFKVMATVTAVIKEFLSTRKDIKTLYIEPSKSFEDDERRSNLYKKYIEKNLDTEKYSVDLTSGWEGIITIERNENINENQNDPIDSIKMDVPLFLRSLEYAREDAKDDIDLHDFTEKAIQGTKQKGTLSMKDYDDLTRQKIREIVQQVLSEQKKTKRDRCLRIADRKYDKPSAYKSGAVVRCRKGDIWKDLKEDESLHKWFKRSGTPGKEGGWVDCNAPIRKDGKITGYKSCGRKKGEKRAKYPSCRPTPAKCKDKGKGKTWGKTK